MAVGGLGVGCVSRPRSEVHVLLFRSANHAAVRGDSWFVLLPLSSVNG